MYVPFRHLARGKSFLGKNELVGWLKTVTQKQKFRACLLTYSQTLLGEVQYIVDVQSFSVGTNTLLNTKKRFDGFPDNIVLLLYLVFFFLFNSIIITGRTGVSRIIINSIGFF